MAFYLNIIDFTKEDKTVKKLFALCLTVVLCVCCLASCGILGFHSISYQDADTESLLMDGYAPKRAKPGDTVVLRTGTIMDADLDFYANGVKLENTHNDSDYWEYTFIMPDEDVVITHDIIGGFGPKECLNHIDENNDGICDDCGHKHTITYVSAGTSGHFENYTCGCPHDDGALPHYDENGDYICDACGYVMSETATNTGKVQTKISEDASLPQFMSLEVDKHNALSNGSAISVDVYMGYDILNKDGAAFSGIVVPESDFGKYTFVLEVNYNNEERVIALDSLNYFEEYKCDMYQGIVQYSKYNTVQLDTTKMTGKSYGFVNLELIMLSDTNERYYVSAETLYYSVTDTEIVFGLVSNPVATEGDPGIITKGWEYVEPSNSDTNDDLVNTPNNNDDTTENGGNGTTENGGNGTTNVVNDGMVRTVLNGGGQGAASLPHYVSTEVVKRCLISNETVSANIYLGHATFRNSVAFSDFVLDVSELQNCSFSIIANYNGATNVVLVENVNYTDELYKITTTDLYDENEVYKGNVVNYSKYHSVNLDIASMMGVPYGYVNIELHLQLPDGTESVVVSDTVYYSVTETEIVFGLVSNPIAHEGDPGIITNGWTYVE